MKYLLISIVWLCSVFITYGQTINTTRPAKWAQPVADAPIKNMYKLDEGVYRCGQPDEKGFVALQQLGIHEVLNLRNWHNDSKEAQGTPIVLHRVEMDAHNVNNAEVIEALRIIKNRKGDIAIHCKHGSDRTGVVCAMYRVVFQGWSKEDAIDELKNGGYGYHRIYGNIPKYIEKADIEKIKREVNK